MIKVLHIITSPCNGGAEVLVRELVARMNDDDIQSEALYFNARSPCAKNIKLASNEYVLDVGFRSPKAIFLIRNYVNEKLKYNSNLIVHAHLTWPMFFVPLALTGLNVKTIFTEHDTSNGRRKFPVLRYIERFFYSSFDKIICISEGTKLALDAWIGEKLSKRTIVIHNGARLYKLKERSKPATNIKFISIGSLFKKKGFDRTIEALARWHRKDWSYTIIGEGPERANLEQLITKCNLNDHVHLIGWSDEIEKHLHDADIQLIPSRFEGFGLVAVEGMSTGLPVIASNVPGLNEVLATTNRLSSYLVSDPDNLLQWHNAIEFFIDRLNESLVDVSKSSSTNALLFGLDLMSEKYKNIYLGVYNALK